MNNFLALNITNLQAPSSLELESEALSGTFQHFVEIRTCRCTICAPSAGTASPHCQEVDTTGRNCGTQRRPLRPPVGPCAQQSVALRSPQQSCRDLYLWKNQTRGLYNI